MDIGQLILLGLAILLPLGGVYLLIMVIRWHILLANTQDQILELLEDLNHTYSKCYPWVEQEIASDEITPDNEDMPTMRRPPKGPPKLSIVPSPEKNPNPWLGGDKPA